MLVLSRKPGEKVVIPIVNVTVEVLRVNGRQVSLGITAPKSVVVNRAEVAVSVVRPHTKG